MGCYTPVFGNDFTPLEVTRLNPTKFQMETPILLALQNAMKVPGPNLTISWLHRPLQISFRYV